MTPRDTVLTFRPDEDVYAAMEGLREQEGVPFSEQIRRALRAWLESKGLLPPAPPRDRRGKQGRGRARKR